MITSLASAGTLDRIRRLAGPDPEGSKLTSAERIHLIFLLYRTIDPCFSEYARAWTANLVLGQLAERGLSEEDWAGLFALDATYTAVDVADLIAVHPKLQPCSD